MAWVQRWDVVGSTGAHYVVGRKDNGEFGCSCPAWKFQRGDRRTECKHIQEIKRKVVAKNAPTVDEPRDTEGKWYI